MLRAVEECIFVVKRRRFDDPELNDDKSRDQLDIDTEESGTGSSLFQQRVHHRSTFLLIATAAAFLAVVIRCIAI